MEKTQACPSYFLDYFEPIPHVTFTTDTNIQNCVIIKLFYHSIFYKIENILFIFVIDKIINQIWKVYVILFIKECDVMKSRISYA